MNWPQVDWQQAKELFASVKVGRVAIAFLFTFILADTCPHPALSKGLLETTLTHISSIDIHQLAGE